MKPADLDLHYLFNPNNKYIITPSLLDAFCRMLISFANSLDQDEVRHFIGAVLGHQTVCHDLTVSQKETLGVILLNELNITRNGRHF